MINLNFLFWNFLFLIIYAYFEFLISLVFKNIFNKTKNYTILNSKKTTNSNVINFKTQTLNIINLFLIFYFFTLKINIQNNLISFIFIYLIINQIFINYLKNTIIYFINFNIICFIFFFFFINNLITFYIYIELYGIIYYFFFLNSVNNSKNYLIQYKNNLLLYLLNNFITSILYLFSITLILNKCGSLNFLELNYVNNINLFNILVYLLIISFVVKLSLPGFHFLKLEIYKYLNTEIVILFSVITLYINYIFIFYFFNVNIIFNILQTYK